MKILEITSANFGNIHISVPVKFDNGLNLWVSQNQAGKTTLLTFLEWMLYGPASKRGAKAPDNIQRWVPWQGAVPGGTLVVAPELKTWPKQLIVRADFAKYEITVEDSATGRNYTEHVTVDKAGEWNLGQLLLNLGRESFRYSLAVMQDNLLDPLRQGHLRQILTSDLGSLVENPNLSVIDRVIEQLNGPQFSLAGSMALPLADHRRALEKELDFLHLEQERLDQHLGEFRELLLTRDSITAQFEEQQRVIYGLDRQAEQLELARNYYLLRGSGRQAPNGSAPQANAPASPASAITPELEREVSKLAAQLEVIENQLALETQSLQALQGTGDGAPAAPAAHAAVVPPGLAAMIEGTQQDFEQAVERVAGLAQSIPDSQRKRFEELRKLYEPHHEQLSTLMNWQREHMQTNDDLAKLRERRVELEYLSRIQLPKRFYAGLGLILPAIYFSFASIYYGGFIVLGYILAAICWIIAAVFCSSFWRARQKTGPHVTELRTQVLPAMEASREQMQALDRRRRRFIDMYQVARLDYDKLVENILEYTQLDMQLREYNSAIRDRDTLQRKLHSAWSRICESVPLAPPSLDLKWLKQQLAQAATSASAEDSAVEIKTRLAERQADVERLAASRQRMLDQISRKLEAAGMAVDSHASLQAVIDHLRQAATAAEHERHASELSQALAGSGPGMALNEEEFDYRWEQLPKATQSQLMQLVGTLAGYQSGAARLQEISKTRKLAEQEREQLRQQLDDLRDQLTRFGLLDAESTQLEQRVGNAKARHELVLRWEQGVALTRQIMDSLVTRAGQDVAPEINKELQHVLETAPIEGLRSATLGPALELRLELAGMPNDVPLEERWLYLSAGAQAQLALVIRLALAQTASGRTGLPLLLDEPFSELDDERAALLFGYLTRLAKSCQIILTTCHGLLAKWLLEQYKNINALEVNK
jgi:hypothetical protein